MFVTKLTQALGIRSPLIQAPMANNNITTPELVAAVSNAGGLGMLAAGYITPEKLREAIVRTKGLTDQPFGVNLFVPLEFEVDGETVRTMNQHLDAYRKQLEIPESPNVTKYAQSFDEQLEVVADLGVKVCSFTFGLPPKWAIEKLKARGTYLVGTATTVKEAIQVEQDGLDAVVAQGSEAGGHRGTFPNDARAAAIGTMALIPQVVDHVRIPVIAAGGIMDGRGLAAALLLGAVGVQMGTAFLACEESGAPELYKHAVLTASEEQTVLTKVYSGKEARGIDTDFVTEMSAYHGAIPPYPVQNALTTDIRKAAAAQGNPQLMSIWAGQGLRLTTTRKASDIVQDTIRRAQEVFIRFGMSIPLEGER